MKNSKFRIIAITSLFILTILFPLLNDSFGIFKDIESTENRKMSDKPEMEIENLDPYPSKYEKYYNDNFTLRSFLIKQFNLINLTFFDKSPLPNKVIIGKDGWLFMAERELECYRGVNALTKEQLEEFDLELEYRRQYLEKRGCKVYFLIAPVKATIYENLMPSNIYRVSEISRTRQLNAYLKQKSKINVIDVYDILHKNKNRANIYKKLDNHWSDYGGFVVSNYIFSEFKKKFPEIDTLDIADFNIKTSETNGGNIVNMLSNIDNFKDIVYTFDKINGWSSSKAKNAGYIAPKGFPYKWEYENVRETNINKKHKLLIISDSFGEAVFPFLSEQFNRTVKIFDSWQYKLNEDIVEKEKPDIVLYIVLESNVLGLLQNQSRPKQSTN